MLGSSLSWVWKLAMRSRARLRLGGRCSAVRSWRSQCHSLYRHQVWAVGRQVHPLDSQLFGAVAHRDGVVVPHIVPAQDQAEVGIAVPSACSIWLVVSALAQCVVHRRTGSLAPSA